MQICPFAWLPSALSGSGVSLVFCPLIIFLSVSPAASYHHPEILSILQRILALFYSRCHILKRPPST